MSDATATVAVLVAAPQDRAFALFVHEIDRWWRRGPNYRHAGSGSGSIAIEPHLDGRVFERWRDDGSREHEFELGRVIAWDPPSLLRFTWRNATFEPIERTEVEVRFSPAGDGTLVTVRHHGWETLRPDHPARHGLQGAAMAREVGMWWGNLLSSLRALSTAC